MTGSATKQSRVSLVALDCRVAVAPRNDVSMIYLPRGAFRPSFASSITLSSTEGAGQTGWPLHPVPPRKKDLRERENHRYRRLHSGLPCAMVYNLYVLSSVNQHFATVARTSSRDGLSACMGAPGPHVSITVWLALACTG